MKVCQIVCLVLYILSYVLCYLIIGVCQWEHLHESLSDCVSYPVYIVVRLMLFNYRCVSVRASSWKFVRLCVLSCIYCRTSYITSLYLKIIIIIVYNLYMLRRATCSRHCLLVIIVKGIKKKKNVYNWRRTESYIVYMYSQAVYIHITQTNS